jgi:hypothetical protein
MISNKKFADLTADVLCATQFFGGMTINTKNVNEDHKCQQEQPGKNSQDRTARIG